MHTIGLEMILSVCASSAIVVKAGVKETNEKASSAASTSKRGSLSSSSKRRKGMEGKKPSEGL